MYQHADQSWRGQPTFMSDEVFALAAVRIAEHAERHGLSRVAVIFHGGEPLLIGAGRLAGAAAMMRDAMPEVQLDFGLQTNGTLLDDQALDALEAADIGISLSIDGDREANDRHRLTHGGRSSFEPTAAALERLRGRPSVFAGVIGVIDPANSPRDILGYLAGLGAPQVDLLLPDANHLVPPAGRAEDPDLYARWMVEAFDTWFDEFPDLPVRTFESMLDTVAGMPSQTDAFGFGDVSMLTVETDGSLHDLDVLKVTAQGATALGHHLETSTIDQAAASPVIAAHRLLLSPAGLSEQCRACEQLDACGGGSVPHRFDGEGFEQPSVYCHELWTLLEHARTRVESALVEQQSREQQRRASPTIDVDLALLDSAEQGVELIAQLRSLWAAEAEVTLLRAVDHAAAAGVQAADGVLGLPQDVRREIAVQPAVAVWAHVLDRAAEGQQVVDLAGRPMPAEPEYAARIPADRDHLIARTMRWHPDDEWLRRPFEDGRVVFEDDLAEEGRQLGRRAFALIEGWRPALADEIRLLSRDVLFVRDLTAHPDKVVSFSDDSAPGALYCSIRRSDGLIDEVDLADSLVHEHRHQKLYLMDRYVPVVLRDRPLVASPWREDPRPPSGLLHAVFVFVELLEFWRHLADQRVARANGEVETISGRLADAFTTLDAVLLTEQGRRLVDALRVRAQL